MRTVGRYLRIEYLLGILMMAVGLLSSMTLFTSSGVWDLTKTFVVVSNIIIALFGAVVFLDRKKSKMRAIGLYSMALGLARVVRSIPEALSPSDIPFVTGIVMIVLGLILLYSGLKYYTGTSRNTLIMRYVAYAIVATYALQIAMYFHSGGTFDGFIEVYRGTALYLAMYIVYVIILSNKEIWSNTPTGRTRDDIHAVKCRISIDSGSIIGRDDLVTLKTGLTDRSSWTKLRNCPVESETFLTLKRSDEHLSVLLQKWIGCEGIHMTFLRNRDDSFLCTEGLVVTNVVPEDCDSISDCRYVRLYSVEGQFIRLAVGDEVE